MRCEVVAVGTELLLGQIVDTNSSWIGEQLALVGIDSHFQTKVGDNWDRIKAVISQAHRSQRRGHRVRRARTDAGRHHARRDRRHHGRAAGARRGDRRDASARSSAVAAARCPRTTCARPTCRRARRSSRRCRAPRPGLVCPVGDKVDLRGAGRALRDAGDGGGHGAARSRAARRHRRRSSSRARCARGATASPASPRSCTTSSSALEREGGARSRSWRAAWKASRSASPPRRDDRSRGRRDARGRRGRSSATSSARSCSASTTTRWSRWCSTCCKQQGLTLGLAESLTGGMIASRARATSRAPSEAFRGSIVSYASDVKFDVLGVPEGPVVSEAAVAAMVEGACRVLKADVGIAVTGVAGPDAQDGEEPGVVLMATLVDGEVEAHAGEVPVRPQPHAAVHDHPRAEQRCACDWWLARARRDDRAGAVVRRGVAAAGRARRDRGAAAARRAGRALHDTRPVARHAAVPRHVRRRRRAIARSPASTARPHRPSSDRPCRDSVASVVVVPVARTRGARGGGRRARRAAVGEPPDPRPFTGHVTIARLKDRPACGVAGHRVHATFPVTELHLVRSDLHPHGARYTTIATRPLRPTSF